MKGAGAALGGLALTTPTVSASASEDRYIIGLQSATESDLAGLDIVHRLDQIDIAIVKGEDAQVRGTRYSKDVDVAHTLPEVEFDARGRYGRG
nr:hypothetical protein [Haladaptatus cibarius]